MDFKIDRTNFPIEQLTSITKEVMFAVLFNVASSARNHWIRLASRDKSHLRTDYINGIQPLNVGRQAWTITLFGEAPHLLEDGSPTLDLRRTLLGPKVPVAPIGKKGKHESKKGGYYRAIPFRHTGPSAGKVVGQAMGSAYSGNLGKEAARKLGRLIHQKAKQLSPTSSSPYKKGTKWGQRLAAGYAPKLKAHHKTDIYAGMVRQQKTYEKATQSQFSTFRTISTNVQEGWIRKPIKARHYAEKVNTFVQRIIPQALEAFVKEATK